MPDLSGLEESYEAPSAEISEAPAVRAALDSVPQLQQLAAAFTAAGAMMEPIDQARSTAGKSEGDRIRIQGTVHLELRCPGVEEEPVFDAATNGTFTLNLAVQENRIRRGFWGDASHCLFKSRVDETLIPVELDGRVEIDIGNDIQLGRSWTRTSMLLSIDGSITVGDVPFQNASARLEQDRFEFLLQTPRGSVVLFVTDSGVGLRDQDATWFCAIGTGTCEPL